jgi:hypothetical protein
MKSFHLFRITTQVVNIRQAGLARKVGETWRIHGGKMAVVIRARQ